MTAANRVKSIAYSTGLQAYNTDTEMKQFKLRKLNDRIRIQNSQYSNNSNTNNTNSVSQYILSRNSNITSNNNNNTTDKSRNSISLTNQ